MESHNRRRKTGKKLRYEWLLEVPALTELTINEYYGWKKGSQVQLHVSIDASEMGLCVVAYMRFDNVTQ